MRYPLRFLSPFPPKIPLEKNTFCTKKKNFLCHFLLRYMCSEKKIQPIILSTIKCYNILSKCMRVLLSESYNLGCFIQIPLTKKFTCTTPYDFVSCFSRYFMSQKEIVFRYKKFYLFFCFVPQNAHPPKIQQKPLQV